MGQIEKFVKDSGVSIPAYNVCFYDSNGTDEIRAGQRYAAALHYPHHKGGSCPV